MSKSALITGITGQDGSYLAELLLEKGYQVYGLVRRLSSPNMSRIEQIVNRITMLEGDLTDQSSLGVALQVSQPDEIYNLAAQSFVAASWNQPILTGDVTGLGVIRLLEAVRHFSPKAKVYQASSSEMFGTAKVSPQNEETPFHPRSPYACAKAFAHHSAVNYRESYNMFVCCGILFNHESPRRGIEFVSRKISDGVARIYYGLSKELRLGNVSARRDWGYAPEYVKAMWFMLQRDNPDDYVVSTGENRSVEEFARAAFAEAELNWKDYLVVDERFYRPADVAALCGDASRARKILGWKPEVTFKQMVSIMVKADMERVKQLAGSRH
jgi:GDPmannose 4,6-dehydratase